MTRAGVAILESAVRAEIFKHKLEGAELIGAFLDLAVEFHPQAGLDADGLRFELDKRLLDAAVATVGKVDP